MAVGWLQLPVPAGGAGDIFSIVFEDHPTDSSKLVLKIFSQGTATDVKSTITSPKSQVRVTRTYDKYASNLVVLQGQPGSGTMPPNISEWTSKEEEYANFPEWRNDISYKAGYYTRWRKLCL